MGGCEAVTREGRPEDDGLCWEEGRWSCREELLEKMIRCLLGRSEGGLGEVKAAVQCAATEATRAGAERVRDQEPATLVLVELGREDERSRL